MLAYPYPKHARVLGVRAGLQIDAKPPGSLASAADEFRAYLAAMAPLDARHYIGQAAPAHLLFQFARTDPSVSVEDAERYFDLASSPKQLMWYDDCGQELSAQARVDRVNFLAEQIGILPPSQEVCQLLLRVPEPVPVLATSQIRWQK